LTRKPLGREGAERDQQIGFPGPGVPDQAQRLAFADPLGGAEGVDGGGVDVRVRVELEVGVELRPRESCGVDPSDGGPAVAVVDLGEEQLGEE